MTGSPAPIPDDVWHAAFDWLMRIEDHPQDTALQTRFQDWLGQSEEHRQAYERLRATWSAAPHLTANGLLAVPQPPVAPLRSGLSRRRMLAGLGASAMAAGLALVAGTGGLDQLRSDYATATGEFRKIGLEDGSQVELDTASALRVDFENGRRRTALLDGRAFFDVVHDRARPFSVSAGPAEIRVLGTRFGLRLDAESVSVAVEAGRVAVDLHGTPLTPDGGVGRGESLRIDLATGKSERRPAVPGVDMAWRTGRLEVEDWPIDRVLAELDRYHRGVIVVGDDAFGRQRISGSFDLTRPEQAARSIAQAQGGLLRRISPWILLVNSA